MPTGAARSAGTTVTADTTIAAITGLGAAPATRTTDTAGRPVTTRTARRPGTAITDQSAIPTGSRVYAG